LHEFQKASIKFSMPSPTEPSKQTRVWVSLAHVVRIVPYYFVESGGKRMVTTVDPEKSRGTPRGLNRAFIVYDALGGQYDSNSASPAGQNHLQRMWEESA
jgi:hypothetical protein